MDLITKILMWVQMGKAPESFDPKFVHSCKTQLRDGRELSAKQITGLENIIERFGINGNRDDRKDGQRRKY